jgi:hypothetical protein
MNFSRYLNFCFVDKLKTTWVPCRWRDSRCQMLLHERPLLPKQHARFVASHVLCPTISTMNKKIFAVSEKKKLRHFNRKRKLEAFFNVALANDKQRQVSKKKKIWTHNNPLKMLLILHFIICVKTMNIIYIKHIICRIVILQHLCFTRKRRVKVLSHQGRERRKWDPVETKM